MATASPPALSDAQDTEVLTHLLAAKGPRATEDLTKSIASAEATARQLSVELAQSGTGGARSPRPMHLTVVHVAAQLDRARGMRERLATLGQLGSTEAQTATAKFPATTSDGEAHAVLLDVAGQVYIDQTRRFLAQALVDYKARLAGIKGEIESHKIVHAGSPRTLGDPNGCPHQVAYGQFSGSITARDTMTSLTTDLAALAATAKLTQADRVQTAISGAGGATAIATGIREAWLASGAYWTADPGASEVKAKGDALAALDAQLEPLRADGGGALTTSLTTDRQAAASDLDAAKKGADGRLKARISDLVTGASAGSSPELATMISAASLVPKAFVPDFAASLAQAQFEYSEQGPQVVAMIRRVVAAL